jgi:hypothetical protein
MPSAYKSIRIIERKQREFLPVECKVVPLAKTEQQIEREMVQTVESWIDERRAAVKEFARSNSATGLRRLGAT